MFLGQMDQIDELSLIKWLESFLLSININIAPTNVIDALRERTGLIVGPGIYTFAHKSIAEYLVAESIIEGDQRDRAGKKIDRFSLYEHRNDDRWNTVTFLWAGLAPLTDVESFIEECINIGTFSIAFGLLKDQFERFPIEALRRFLIEMNSKLEHDSYHHFYISHIHKRKSIDIPVYKLRSINDTDGSFNMFYLINMANYHHVISCDDLPKLYDNNYLLYWICFTIFPIDLKSLNKSLSYNFPASYDKEILVCLIFDMLIDRSLSGYTDINIEALIETFQEMFPQYCYLLPLYLLSNLVVFCELDGIRVEKLKLIKQILRIISSSKFGQYNESWLLGSKYWFFNNHRLFSLHEDSIDLLSKALELFNELSEFKEMVQSIELLETTSLVTSMINQREAIK